MKKLILLLAFVVTAWLQHAHAQNNRVVPLFFHGSSHAAGMSVDNIYKTVCLLNKHYYNENDVKITFMVAGISAQISPNTLKSGINIIVRNNAVTTWSNQLDLLAYDGFDDTALTREMGRALDLLYPEGGNPAGTACPSDSDCCADTPPIPNGNWMNKVRWSGPRTFTNAQKARIYGYLDAKADNNGWDTRPARSCLRNAANYTVPADSAFIARLFGYQMGYISLQYRACTDASTPIWMKYWVTTQCPDRGRVGYSGVVSNLPTDTTIVLDFTKGVKYVDYQYFYGLNISHTKRVYYNLPSVNVCGQAAQKGTSIGGEIEQAGNNTIIYANAKQIIYENSDYSTFELYDVSGRLMMKGKFNTTSGKVDCNVLPDGLYILKAIKPTGEVKTLKLYL